MNSTDTSTKALPTDSASVLNELIDIAPGAIVSRVLASTTGGTVTLFAFDGGQGLSEHTAPFDALVQLLDGELELQIGGIKVLLKPGEIVRMPANVPHALKAVDPCRMVLTMLREPKTEV
ncbi:MAG: cupin domain-containing protein [Thermoanaerobaculales bacterium]|nr:cupin domain-containing protein [Thermoanaerobaculales bacterium]